MSYLDVLKHLKEFKVDRIVLSDFSEDWSKQGTVTISKATDHNTIHANSLQVESMVKDDIVYTSLTDPLRLDDRDLIQLHVYSTIDVPEASLNMVLSDSVNLATTQETVQLPKLIGGSVNVINMELVNPNLLSNIRSVGLKVLTNITGPLYLSAFNALTSEYITTVEDLEAKIKDGEGYVLSKLGPDYTTIPTDNNLQEAVYLAAAGYAWLKQKENEQFQFDYGNQTSTKNYGVKLLTESRIRVENYIAQGDVENDSNTGTEKSYINTALLDGSCTEHHHHHYRHRRHHYDDEERFW